MLTETASGHFDKEAFISNAIRSVGGLGLAMAKGGGAYATIGNKIARGSIRLGQHVSKAENFVSTQASKLNDIYKSTKAYKKFGYKPLIGAGAATAFMAGRLSAGNKNSNTNELQNPPTKL